MKVAVVVVQFPHVSETFILNQITGLIDRGNDLDIFADAPGSMPQPHRPGAASQPAARTHYTPATPRSLLELRLSGVTVLAASAMRNPTLLLRALAGRRYHDDISMDHLVLGALPPASRPV